MKAKGRLYLLPLIIPTKIFLISVCLGAPDPSLRPDGSYLRHWGCTKGPAFYLINIVCPHRYTAVRGDGRPSWPRPICKLAERK